jgi:hypothetical protein
MNISLRLLKNYPYLFLADGLISIMDELLLVLFESTLLKGFRSGVAYIVLVLAIPYVYALFKVRPPLFKKYLLLPLYHVVAGILSLGNIFNLVSSSSIFITFALELSPYSILQEHPGYFIFQVILTLMQIGVAVYVLISHSKIRVIESHPNPQRGLGFLFSSILVVMEILMIIGTIPLLLIASTKGFLGFQDGKITSIERVYKKDNKTVHLLPMVHVGDENFYKDVSVVDSKEKTLFLLEGVKDKDDLIKNLNYDKFASKIGLDKQGDHFKPQAKDKELQKNISYIVADIDVSEFSPESREFLKTTFNQLNDKSTLEVLFMDSGEFTSKEASHLVIDLMDKRNDKVIQEFKSNQDKFQTIYIPWGAAHMPELERAILKEGYKLTDSRERPVISLKSVLERMNKKQ